MSDLRGGIAKLIFDLDSARADGTIKTYGQIQEILRDLLETDSSVVEYGVLLDDRGSMDLYDTEAEVAVALGKYGGDLMLRRTTPWAAAE